MKKLLKILIIVAVIFIVVFGALSIFVYSQGKRVVTAKLQVIFSQPVEIGDIHLTLPRLRIKDLHIGGMLKIKEVSLGLGFINLFNKEINLSQVTLLEPQYVIHKPSEPLATASPDLISQPQEGGQQNVPNPQRATSDKAPQPHLFINTLIVKNGRVQFVEHVINDVDKVVAFQNVNLKAANVAFPLMYTKTIFDFRATLGGDETFPTESLITGQGWVDVVKGNMESKIAVKDIDSKVLINIFSGEDTFLKNAIVDLTADLDSKNNDMQVNCKVKVKELAFNSSKGDSDSASFEDILLKGLQKAGQGIAINFRFKTKMDEFKIESIAFSGNVYDGSGNPENTPEAVAPSHEPSTAQ